MKSKVTVGEYPSAATGRESPLETGGRSTREEEKRLLITYQWEN